MLNRWTKERFDNYLNDRLMFKRRLSLVANTIAGRDFKFTQDAEWEFNAIRNIKTNEWIDDYDTILISEGYSGDYEDTYRSFSFPTRCIYDNDYIAQYMNELEIKRLKEIADRKEKERIYKEKEALEYKEYRKKCYFSLKKEFENE